MRISMTFQNPPETMELVCGNFGFERAAAHEGGPIIVTVVDGVNKQSADNEILGVYTGVTRVSIVDPNEAYQLATPPANGLAVSTKATGKAKEQ